MQQNEKPKRTVFAWIASLGVLGFKYFKLIFGSAKFLGLLKSFLSMGLSICAYAAGHGWAFAGIFVALLMIHELGHVWAAKRIGLPVSTPLFIPFFGAMITMKQNPRSASEEAFMAIGGPIFGTVGALVVFTLSWILRSDFLLHMAWVGFFLNLFNLIPVSPLDGGRIVAAVSPWLWLIGVVILMIVLALLHAWFFMIVILLMAMPSLKGLFQRGRDWNVYHCTTPKQRWFAGIALMALAVVLASECYFLSEFNSSTELVLLLVASWPVIALITILCCFFWPLEEASLNPTPNQMPTEA